MIFLLSISFIFCAKYIIILKPEYSNDQFSRNEIESILIENNSNFKKIRLGYISELNFSTFKELKSTKKIKFIEKDSTVKVESFIDNNFIGNNKDKYINNTIYDDNFIDNYINNTINGNYIDNNKINNNYMDNKIYDDFLDNKIFDNFKKNENETGKNIKSNQDKSIIDQLNANWGLSRLSSGHLPSQESKFRYPKNPGKGVKIFILDTGIDVTHKEFEGRAEMGKNFVDEINTDENGHGTHCAGIAAGKNVGVAKESKIIGVKVLNKLGKGEVSDVVMGIDYVIDYFEKEKEINEQIPIFKMRETVHELKNEVGNKIFFDGNEKIKNLIKKFSEINSKKKSNPKFVVNMSIGGVKSKAMDMMVAYGTSLGINFIVAAGNENKNACNFSPSSNNFAITVGASDKNDRESSFTNFGDCVDVYAPGVGILSSIPQQEYKMYSGTSMASPHVAGVASIYLSKKDMSPFELKEKIIKNAYKIIKMKNKEPRMRFFGLFKSKRNNMLLVSIRKHLREIYYNNNL